MTTQETRPLPPIQSGNNVSPQLVEEQFDRIVRHPLFANSHSLRAFLEYVVRKTLAGSSDQIKEYTIATEILGRNEDFDARDTSLVRTKAFNVRAKLKAYYERDGAEDPVLIVLEPGSYVPTFKFAAIKPPSERRETQPGNAIRLALVASALNPPNPALQLLLDSFLRALTVSLVQSGPFHVTTLNPAVSAANPGEAPSDFVIQPHLQQVQSQFKLDLQAQQSPNHYVVWASSFAWDQADFEPSRAASQVAVQLSRAISKVVGGSPAQAPISPAVSAACAEGFSFLARNNPTDCRRAARRFLHATDLEKDFSPAHAGFALAIFQSVTLGDPESAGNIVDAEVSALQALALDFNAPYAQLARGAALALVEWDFNAAQRYVLRAEQWQPSNSPDPLFSAWIALLKLLPERRFSEAVSLLQPIVQIFPSHLFARVVLGTALRLDQRYPQALAVLSAAYEYDTRCGSAALNIAWTLASSGDLKKAQETLQSHKDTLGRIAPVVGLEGYLAAAQGQHDLAIALEAELTSLAKAKPYSSGFFERALIAHALGQSARARSLFQMSLHAQESSAFLGRLEPLLAPLTRDAAEPESRS